MVVLRRLEIWRKAHPQAAQQDKEHEHRAIDHERTADAVVCDQPAPGARELHPHHRAQTEPGHGDTGDETFLVREPLHANSDGHDVAEPDTGATEHADAEQDRPEAVTAAHTGQKIAGTQHHAAGRGQPAWTEHKQLAARVDHDQRKRDQSYGERPLCCRCGPARILKRLGEYRPGINRSQRKLNQQCAANHPSTLIVSIFHIPISFVDRAGSANPGFDPLTSIDTNEQEQTRSLNSQGRIPDRSTNLSFQKPGQVPRVPTLTPKHRINCENRASAAVVLFVIFYLCYGTRIALHGHSQLHLGRFKK